MQAIITDCQTGRHAPILKEHPVADARRLVDKLWSYCNVLRDDGVRTLEYTEQLTNLLVLTMVHTTTTRGRHNR